MPRRVAVLCIYIHTEPTRFISMFIVYQYIPYVLLYVPYSTCCASHALMFISVPRGRICQRQLGEGGTIAIAVLAPQQSHQSQHPPAPHQDRVRPNGTLCRTTRPNGGSIDLFRLSSILSGKTPPLHRSTVQCRPAPAPVSPRWSPRTLPHASKPLHVLAQ